MEWKEFLKETIAYVNRTAKSEILNELRKILVIISTSNFNDSLLKYYESNKELAEKKIEKFESYYKSLIYAYNECNYNSFIDDQEKIRDFLKSSKTFLMSMYEVPNIDHDEKNAFETAGIVVAFYEVFIRKPFNLGGGRKRISKSFQNSRIRRRSYGKRRTVKSRRVKSRRRLSVKRRRL